MRARAFAKALPFVDFVFLDAAMSAMKRNAQRPVMADLGLIEAKYESTKSSALTSAVGTTLETAEPGCEIGMESCGAAHHWARRLQVRALFVAKPAAATKMGGNGYDLFRMRRLALYSRCASSNRLACSALSCSAAITAASAYGSFRLRPAGGSPIGIRMSSFAP